MGDLLAIIGAAMVVIVTGVGAALGMSWVQRSAAGVIAEEPEKYGKTLILQLIPSASGLYGFVVGFMVLLNSFVLGEGGYTVTEGVIVLLACLPMTIVGVIQVLLQAKVSVACVNMVAKNEELSGRAITMAIFTEIFALFALIVSILSVMMITPGSLPVV